MVYYTGQELSKLVTNTLSETPKQRFIINELDSYVKDDNSKRVCCLYGLRRTGKTTMIMHEILNINSYENSLYILCENKKENDINVEDSISMVKETIDKHPKCKYIFIDEITKTSDFIRTSSILANIYTAIGKKVVITGTDSLGILFARYDELYGRTQFINTTYIPFKEYNYLLGKGIMDYIKYGGTLTPENVFYNKDSLNEYSNSAITQNIENSINKTKVYQNKAYSIFEDMLKRGELASLINKIVEYPTREFLAEIVNNSFKSHDLGSLSDLIFKHRIADSRIINTDEMGERIRAFLCIKANPFNYADVESIDIIISYLEKLEVIYHIPIESYLTKPKNDEYIFTQPGIRYGQATSIANALVTSEEFDSYSVLEKKLILDKLNQDICGGILEDIVFYQSTRMLSSEQISESKYLVTKHRNEYGQEADVVIIDLDNHTVVEIEVKLSNEINANQIKHLIDIEFTKEIERLAGGPIINKVVVYCGDNTDYEGVLYLNVQSFLYNLDDIVKQLSFKHISSVKEVNIGKPFGNTQTEESKQEEQQNGSNNNEDDRSTKIKPKLSKKNDDYIR